MANHNQNQNQNPGLSQGPNQVQNQGRRAPAQGAGRSAETLDAARIITPPVDIFENDQEMLLVADLPGVNKEDLRVHLDKDQLTVEAKRSYEGTDFQYRRSFVIAQVFNVEKVTARLDKGVLKVSLPKSEAVKPRQIQVQVG